LPHDKPNAGTENFDIDLQISRNVLVGQAEVASQQDWTCCGLKMRDLLLVAVGGFSGQKPGLIEEEP
jgi:hypothetical protein